MQDSLRNQRRVHLRGASRHNPHQIIRLYRVTAGLLPHEPLPQGVTLSEMIESILDREHADSRSSGVLRAIAG
jgi:hypothetical protein